MVHQRPHHARARALVRRPHTQAYLALRAALTTVLRHNERAERPIRSILCPGLGTAVGGMPVHRCARQMRVACERVVLGKPFIAHSLSAATRDEMELLVRGCAGRNTPLCANNVPPKVES